MEQFRLVIISGVSGSGKSTALNAFDDIGYFCVDNLPAPLISSFVDYLQKLSSADDGNQAQVKHNYALLLHLRDKEFFPLIQSAVSRLRAAGTEVLLLYFDCQDDVIVRRFQETRRPHPFLSGNPGIRDVREALTFEKDLLADFRAAADRVIDTSAYTPHDLRRAIETFFESPTDPHKLEVTLLSFGFKYGLPVQADIVLDVRFLSNPHFVADLRPLTGEDSKVSEYVFQSPHAREFMDRVSGLIRFLGPLYRQEGKRYLTVAIGCTGGQHRSVAIVNKLSQSLKGIDVTIVSRHRDLERSN